MKIKPSQKAAAPAEWAESIKLSMAQLAAGQYVDSDEVLAQGEAAIARIEARRKNTLKSDVA